MGGWERVGRWVGGFVWSPSPPPLKRQADKWGGELWGVWVGGYRFPSALLGEVEA